MYDNVPCRTAKSAKTSFLRRILLLWSGLLKAQTWIRLRMLGSYSMKELKERNQETSKNYGLIWKENGRNIHWWIPNINSFRITKDVKLLSKVKVYTSSTNELWTLFSLKYDIHYNCMILLIVLMFSIIYRFQMLYNYSYNFIKISLLSFIFWNYIIYLYILIFPW